MFDPEKIQGERLFSFFEQLKQNKTLLSLRLIGKDFERLTLIVDLKKGKKANYIQIDPPNGFKDATIGLTKWEINFKLNGPDGLDYRFETVGGHYADNDILIPFPDYVERLQRRRHFRIDVPIGTKLSFEFEKNPQEISLINISMGGAYGVLKKRKPKDTEIPRFEVGQSLNRIEILFPELFVEKVFVDKVIVRRVEHDPGRNKYRYAVEFVDIDNEEKKKLKEVIYHLQVQLLKKR